MVEDDSRAGMAMVLSSPRDALHLYASISARGHCDLFRRAYKLIIAFDGTTEAVAGLTGNCVRVFVWPPEPVPSPTRPQVAEESWVTQIARCAADGVAVYRVQIPEGYQDVAGWCKGVNAGLATVSVVHTAAEQVEKPKRPSATDSAGVGPLVSLMDVSPGIPDPRNTVLGNRFLCIGGAMLFVGPSGIGKSSASMQMDILWALGREAFGIAAARPLNILTIQAENDAEDLAEMRDGVCRGMELSPEDLATVRDHVFYDTVGDLSGEAFLAFVEQRLMLKQFDLLRLDHLTAYLGGDVSKSSDTIPFLREGLNALLKKYGVACIVNHHTPKVTNRDTSGWRPSDWMYAGAGAADLTNWARAILVIDPTHAPQVFKFIAAKREGRIGWVDEQGKREIVRHYCHARDGLYWRDADDTDLKAVEDAASAKKGRKPHKTPADLMALVPDDGAIPKVELLRLAMERGFTKHGADATLKDLLESGYLFRWQIKRAGTNAEVRIARREQGVAEGNG